VRVGFAALVGALLACRASAPFPASAGVPAASPAALGFDSTRLAGVVDYLRGQVDSGAFPGAVLAVGRHGRVALLAAVGRYGTDDARPVDPGTLYDLASLTKVVGLTTACMQLVDEGRLALDAPVRRYLPEFQGGGDKERVTVRHLLTHSSGLPAWRPLYREAGSRAAALALADTTPLATAPGERFVYSDLGAIVLMQIVERISGEPLDRWLARRVFGRWACPRPGTDRPRPGGTGSRPPRPTRRSATARCGERCTTKTRGASAASRGTRASSPTRPTCHGSQPCCSPAARGTRCS